MRKKISFATYPERKEREKYKGRKKGREKMIDNIW